MKLRVYLNVGYVEGWVAHSHRYDTKVILFDDPHFAAIRVEPDDSPIQALIRRWGRCTVEVTL